MKAVNIKWDTDGENVNLPTEIDIPDDLVFDDEISDYLSDKTGFCHFGYELEKQNRIKVIIRDGVVESVLSENSDVNVEIVDINKDYDDYDQLNEYADTLYSNENLLEVEHTVARFTEE